VLIMASVLSAGLVLFIALMSYARTKMERSLAFGIALVSIVAATMLIFGMGQDFLGVIVFGGCPLIGAVAAMRVLSDRGASPFAWGIGAFLGGVVGSFGGLYLGLMVACRGGSC
jgi:hypothetical protein